jgi:type II secretory pathway component PulM
VTALIERLRATFARLNPRERLLVGMLAGLAGAAGAFVFVLEPALAARERNIQRIDALTRDLPVMETLARRIQRFEARSGAASGSQPSADFSLFAFIDKAASASLTRETIASMSPSRRALRDGQEESVVELKVNGASLAEIVAFLQRVEKSEQPIYVKRLEIKRRYDDKTRFDATVITGAVSRS